MCGNSAKCSRCWRPPSASPESALHWPVKARRGGAWSGLVSQGEVTAKGLTATSAPSILASEMNRRRLLSQLAVVALWGVATALYAWAYASSFVHSPESVGYEADWGFQFSMFAIFRLPFLLLALGLLLWVNRRYRI
jgi:hypothetical protein